MKPTNQLCGRVSEKPLEQSKEWMDVTEYISNVCDGMRIGEMVHDHEFKIDRVMSAIEIMDPKMDTGLNYAKRKIDTVEERIKKNTLPLKIKPMHCLEIMDRLLCAEATWYNGRYLTQSVFTCLYINVVEKIDFPYLRLYLILFLKSCEHIHKMMEELKMSGTSVKEDEEFYSRTYDNQIVFDYDIPKTIENCIELEESLKKRIESQKKKSLKESKGDGKSSEQQEEGGEGGADCPPIQSDPDMELFFCEALLYRLQYRRLYLQIHNVFCEEKGVYKFKEMVPTTLSLLKKIATQHRKKKIKSTEIVGFDPEYTRLIHRFIPQKPHPLLDFKESCSHLDNYLSSLLRIADLNECRSIFDFTRFFRNFSMFKPNVIARSYCSLYFKGNNKILTSLIDLEKKSKEDEEEEEEEGEGEDQEKKPKNEEEEVIAEEEESEEDEVDKDAIRPPPNIVLSKGRSDDNNNEGDGSKGREEGDHFDDDDLDHEDEDDEDGEGEDDEEQGMKKRNLLCMNGKVHLGRLVEKSFFRTYNLKPMKRKKKKKKGEDHHDDDNEHDDNNNSSSSTSTNSMTSKEKIVSELMKVREVRLICNQIGICFSIYFYYHLYNRPRLTRKLKNFFVEHLKKVLFNSGVVDHSVTDILTKLSQKKGKREWFFQYVYDLVVCTLRDVTLLQFELELYSPDEYVTMFAYLDRIYSNLCSNVEGMKSVPEIGLEVESNLSSHEQEVEKREFKMYQAELDFKEKMYKLEFVVARALFRMMIYLERAGHFVLPKYPYGNPEQRFKNRTRFYTHLTPSRRPFFQYKDYKELRMLVVQSFSNNQLLLKNVEKHLVAADTRNKQLLKMKKDDSGVGRCVWQKRKYFENLNKVIFGNKLMINLIRKLKRGEKKTVVLDMSYGSFPVIKLKEPYKKK